MSPLAPALPFQVEWVPLSSSINSTQKFIRVPPLDGVIRGGPPSPSDANDWVGSGGFVVSNSC